MKLTEDEVIVLTAYYIEEKEKLIKEFEDLEARHQKAKKIHDVFGLIDLQRDFFDFQDRIKRVEVRVEELKNELRFMEL